MPSVSGAGWHPTKRRAANAKVSWNIFKGISSGERRGGHVHNEKTRPCEFIHSPRWKVNIDRGSRGCKSRHFVDVIGTPDAEHFNKPSAQ